MKRKSKIVFASLVMLAFGFVVFRLAASKALEGSAPTPPTLTTMSAPDLKDIRDYRSWTRVNTTPLLLPAPLDILCRMPTGEDRVATSFNPHRLKYFTVYVNEKGREAMMSQAKPSFPEGSIIVKEKLLAKDAASPELLTVMIKREQGFNRESGDWEYMVVDGARTKIEGRGKLENCQSCHALRSETDYVFRSYLPESALKISNDNQPGRSAHAQRNRIMENQWPQELPVAQVRVARPTSKLKEVVRFYRDGIGLREIGSFEGHAGYSGVMLGLPGHDYHLEFTEHEEGSPGPAPTKDNLIVLYIPDRHAIDRIVKRLAAMGHARVPPENPYWEQKGVTIEDPDGWRVVLMNTGGI